MGGEGSGRRTLTTGRATEEERHLTVGDGLLGEIVEDDERVHAVVAEVLAEGAARVRRKELEGRGVRRGRRHDDRVVHGTGITKGLHQLRDGGALLADRDVDAVERLACGVAGLARGEGSA